MNGELLVDRGSIHGGEQPSREKMRDLYEPFIRDMLIADEDAGTETRICGSDVGTSEYLKFVDRHKCSVQ